MAHHDDATSSAKSADSDIRVNVDAYIGQVKICRPPLNFFDHLLIADLAAAFEALDEDPRCRVIVLSAEGKAFCAGANFGTGQDDDTGNDDFSEQGFMTVTAKLYREGTRLFATRKPIIAAIQGAAVGGGLGLALVADFRVATPDARFAANFVKLGLHQGFGISVTLPRLLGQQTAHQLLLTGRRVSGAEAHQIGLVDLLVERDELLAASTTLAKEIAANAPLAVQSVRATMRDGLAAQIATATEHELAEQQRLRATADAYEGIRAVAERRPGNFLGR